MKRFGCCGKGKIVSGVATQLVVSTRFLEGCAVANLQPLLPAECLDPVDFDAIFWHFAGKGQHNLPVSFQETYAAHLVGCEDCRSKLLRMPGFAELVAELLGRDDTTATDSFFREDAARYDRGLSAHEVMMQTFYST